MSEYKQELLNKLESTPFEELSSIEKCLITETDWRLQNNALQELASYRAEPAELKAKLSELRARLVILEAEDNELKQLDLFEKKG